jgi:superoxide dismutase, Fe-Mn family
MTKTGDASGLSRREFVAAASAVAAVSVAGAPAVARAAAPIELPPLAFADDALVPHISANTIGFHYGKHHRAYVDNTNKLVAGTELAGMGLEELVKTVAGNPERTAIFNNAAQVWNHSFYWKSLKAKGGVAPPAALRQRVEADLGGWEGFVKELSNAAVTQFGSGWAWLVLDAGKLKVVKTANADTPLVHGQVPLLTLDVWEHAYYLDYQNRRADYVKALIENVVNWDFVAENLAKAKA